MKRLIMAFMPVFLIFQIANAELDDSHSIPVYTHQAYTLDDFYAIALERSEQIKISEEDLFIAEREKDRAVSALLPRISAFGDYTRYSEEKVSSTSFGSFPVQSEWSASWGLRLDQSLSLSGRELTAFRISKKGIESRKHDLYAVREDYLFRVSASYYDVLKAMKALEIAKANVDRLTKHRDAARTRLKVGEVTKTAVLRAEAELSGAESEVVKAENSLTLAKAFLARLVGIQKNYSLKEPLTEKIESLDLNILKETAHAERAELKSRNIQRKIAEQEVKYSKGAYWPTLSVEGIYEKRDEDPSSPFFLKESIYGVARLNFPFFEGGLRKAEAKQAEAKLRQAKLSYEDLEKTIQIEVENAYLDLKTQEGILKSLKDQVAFAKDNYNAVTKQFEFGLANSIDVMDANTLLVTAERELANARYDHQLAMLKVKRVTGTMLRTIINQNAVVE